MTIARTAGMMILATGVAFTVGLAPQGAPPATRPVQPTPGGAETFQVDPVHSSNVFKIRHNGVANFYGRFNRLSGTVVWNEKDPAASSINVEIKADSIDTANSARDKHLKSADFFEVETYPTLAFRSTAVKKTGDHTYDVSGDFLLHGVTKPITVKVEHGGVKDTGRQGRRTGLETTFTIKRSEYGMTKFLDGGLGDEVTMTVSLECMLQQKNERE